MSEQVAGRTMDDDGASAGEQPPAQEATPREKREYVVLVGEAAMLDAARNALHELLHGLVDDGGAERVKVAEVIEALSDGVFWGELGRVEAFNRAGALEEVEKRWPSAVEGDDVRLHLVPARFWSEVVPEEQPPPPPRRRWRGI